MQSLKDTLTEHDKNLHKMPWSYQKMVRIHRDNAVEDVPKIPASECSHASFRAIPEQERQEEIKAAKERIDQARYDAALIRRSQRAHREAEYMGLWP